MAAVTAGTSQEDPTRGSEAAEMVAVAGATGEVAATGGHISLNQIKKVKKNKGVGKHSKTAYNTLWNKFVLIVQKCRKSK